MCSVNQSNTNNKLIQFKKMSYIFIINFIIIICVTNEITCDVSVAPNPALIDLSWPYNQNTLIWVEFRNYTMDIFYEGDTRYTNADGSKVW